MKTRYKISCSLKLGAILKPIEEMETSVNASLEEFGVHERVQVRTNAFLIEVTSKEDMTSKEKKKLTGFLETILNEGLPNYNIKVESMRKIPKRKLKKGLKE